jgi:ribosomal protein S18 acetylase RimI-like enzyme
MEIRRAEKEDSSRVYEIGTGTEEFEVSDDEDMFWDKDSLESWFNNQKDVCLVAEESGEVVGFVLSHIHMPTGKVEIENIFVADSHRRCGIATELCQRLLNDYQSKNANFAVALTLQDNDKIHNLNQKVGFQKGENMVWWEYEF